MASVHVEVVPAVLVWARESIGLSREEAARKLDMSPGGLQFLEEGVGGISMPKLRRMAELYDRPLLAFFLPEPPEERDTLPDFRLMPGNHGKAWTPELHEEFRRVVGQRQVMLELAELEEESLPEINLRLQIDLDPEMAGDRVRHWLDASLRIPVPDSSYDVYNTWVGLIEDKAVLVTQVTGIETEEMRGFSIGEHPLPVIAINSRDAIRGKTFTLLHELAHILLRRSALCDLGDEITTPDLDAERLEWFCNEVAAATLMPREALLREELVARASRNARWQDDELRHLSRRFGVSTEAMLLRLVTLDLASREFYRERRPYFLQKYREQREQGTGRITYYKKQIRNLGRRYITTVLDAYDRDEITDADLSRYLGMKLKNVPTLVERLGTEQ